MSDASSEPRRIQLTDERRQHLVAQFQALYAEKLGEDLSDFRAQFLVEIALKELGPSIYNQAIQDAQALMLQKIEDLDGELFEPEDD